ncbi:zinc finger and SCAN domain-containing protein 29-like isoform X3 [Argiope bruennichi]|uniref:Myb/SANT-like DNA-binding domain-containing n=1 Tax=Argiope bruennichi TaxID=94029 RepID=A0A8T0FQ29_ARGBR|nr:zinc finger and SCAN domain-containing protein 29-like isoform X3 [Argiope bruennichi]KAF8792278.1 Myb/SANT-like DNA-binding domain-containing [Argiope bruennichi]
MCAPITADRGFTWSDDETALLLQLWGANDAQSELIGNKRNFIVYEKISETMNNMGFLRTASQCREKIKRMKREYTLVKQQMKQANGPKKNMRFFEQFEKILLEKQSRNENNSSLKFSSGGSGLESEADETEVSKKANCAIRNEHKLKKLAPKNPQLKRVHEIVEREDTGNPWTPDVVLVEQDAPTALFENQSSASTSSMNENLTGRKKRKLSSQMTVFKYMMDSMTLKFMKYQTDFDKKILNKIEELENERSAMDERIQKMWMDFEEKRRVDEKEHELKIMTTFQDIINGMKVNEE